jgi:hypothetical protein
MCEKVIYPTPPLVYCNACEGVQHRPRVLLGRFCAVCASLSGWPGVESPLTAVLCSATPSLSLLAGPANAALRKGV